MNLSQIMSRIAGASTQQSPAAGVRFAGKAPKQEEAAASAGQPLAVKGNLLQPAPGGGCGCKFIAIA